MNLNNQETAVIKEITCSSDDLTESVRVIRNSFATVASEFGLTKDNCPTHPAFMTLARLQETLEKGVKIFGLYTGAFQIGLVAAEKSTDEIYFLERLSVLPNYRHQGYGKILIDYIFDYVKVKEGKMIKIALINEHSVLKKWYLEYGFIETEIKKYSHLPFTVCFMEKDI